jgi:hypothetical protein
MKRFLSNPVRNGLAFGRLRLSWPRARRRRWRRPRRRPQPPLRQPRRRRSTAPAEAAPVPNKGDTAWMMVATVLVILMTIPGLALFYGGLVRAKNMLSVLMQVFVVFSLIGRAVGDLRLLAGLHRRRPFFGGFDKLFLKGVTVDSLGATFSKGVVHSRYCLRRLPGPSRPSPAR